MDLKRELKYDILMPTKEFLSDFCGDLNQKVNVRLRLEGGLLDTDQ